jgi:signal peptidase
VVRSRRRVVVPARARAAVTVRTSTRLLATFALHTILGVTLGLLLALTAPLAFGMRPLVVLSGSMEPVLHVGDVTVVQRVAPRAARVGDVVTFKAPGGGRITTHRVRAVRVAEHGRFVFTTKGDANNSLERWTLPADGQLSRAVYTIPLVGRALLLIHTPLGWALLVGLPLLALGAQEIRRIWRSAPPAASEANDAPLVA